MKKLFFFAAAALAALTVNAQTTLGNPQDGLNRYIVKWDCQNDKFAESNDFEPGETVTIAFDLTGTQWLDLIKDYKGTDNIAPCANLWTNFGPKFDTSNRLVHIKDNIYGATYNLAQCLDAKGSANIATTTAVDSVIYVYGGIFMFEYDNTGETTNWAYDATFAPIDVPGGCVFATLPSTGKVDEEIYHNDYEFPYQVSKTGIIGYAAPCASVVTAVENVTVENTRKVIENGQLILINGDVRYDVTGAVVK